MRSLVNFLRHNSEGSQMHSAGKKNIQRARLFHFEVQVQVRAHYTQSTSPLA